PSSSGAAGAVRRQPGQRLSPAVRRLAAEHALELARIEGTGRNGRITRRDVIRYLQGAKAAVAEPRAAEARPETPGERKIVPFTRIRKLTAEHMVRSKATSAHVLQAVEVDFANVDLVRNQVRDAWRGRRGYSLTYLPFIASAVCEALGEFPNLNASVEGDSLVIHPHVNLAIAVDLGPEGLVAPVIRSAETLSVTELAEAIHEIANRARQGRLKPDDLAGGTYTISNNGSFGTLITAPIINQPQVAILSTDGVRKKPVVVEAPEGDSIAIRPVGILAQSFDHRAVDGAYSGAFLSRVKKILEQRRFGIQP
ncbi:MAG: dihydrolipoamide acetyltransferase family protein, partial [Gammaproteobacteria bacterium]